MPRRVNLKANGIALAMIKGHFQISGWLQYATDQTMRNEDHMQNHLFPNTEAPISKSEIHLQNAYYFRWQAIGMLGIILFVVFQHFTPDSAIAAEVVKTLRFEWQYDTGLSGLTGYVIYHADQPVLTVSNPTVLSIDHEISLETGKTHIFTIKAVYENGMESGLSPPYSLDVPAESVVLKPPSNLRILTPPLSN